jgi:hypothetical protein
MNTTVMQKQIMRRVYYSYAISIGTHPMLWRGVFLGAAAMLLADWLHVASIVNNFLAVPVGAAPKYVASSVMSAATQGEMLTVVVLALAGVVALTSAYKMFRQFTLHTLFVQTA